MFFDPNTQIAPRMRLQASTPFVQDPKGNFQIQLIFLSVVVVVAVWVAVLISLGIGFYQRVFS